MKENIQYKDIISEMDRLLNGASDGMAQIALIGLSSPRRIAIYKRALELRLKVIENLMRVMKIPAWTAKDVSKEK